MIFFFIGFFQELNNGDLKKYENKIKLFYEIGIERGNKNKNIFKLDILFIFTSFKLFYLFIK